MKVIIVALLVFSVICLVKSEDKFLSEFLSQAQKQNLDIRNTSSLMKNIQTNVTVVSDIIPQSNLKALTNLGVPKEMVESFEDAIFSSGLSSFPSILSYNSDFQSKTMKFSTGFGAVAAKNGLVRFSYIEIKQTEEIIPQKVVVKFKKCKRFLIFKSCSNESREEIRNNTEEESQLMLSGLSGLANRAIVNKIKAMIKSSGETSFVSKLKLFLQD